MLWFVQQEIFNVFFFACYKSQIFSLKTCHILCCSRRQKWSKEVDSCKYFASVAKMNAFNNPFCHPDLIKPVFDECFASMSCCIFSPLEKALCYVYIKSSVLRCTELQGGDPGKNLLSSEYLLKSSVHQLLLSFVIDWIDSRESSFIFMQDFWLLFTVNHSLTPISLAKHVLIFWG